MVAGGPVSWECKRQDIVALSTVEVKFMVFSKTTTQALWLLKYFNEVGLSVIRPLKIFADNSSSISNSLNDKNHWYMIWMCGITLLRNTQNWAILYSNIHQQQKMWLTFLQRHYQRTHYTNLYIEWDSIKGLQVRQSRESVEVDLYTSDFISSLLFFRNTT